MPTPHPAPPVSAGSLDPRQLERLRTLVTLLESALRIPGTRIRFGADAIIGIVPGLGDLVGGLVSALIVSEAIRAGVPRAVLLRMFTNVAVDMVGGAVPVAGDLFDVAWKAGARNLRLLEAWHERPDRTAGAARRDLLLLAAGIGLVAALGMALAISSTILLLRWLAGS